MTKFEEEILRVLKIRHPKIEAIHPDTRLDTDSLGLTEICVLAEEYYNKPLTFAQIKDMDTFSDLMRVIEG